MKIALILAAAPHDALRDLEPFMPLSLPLLAGAAPEHDYRFVDMLRSDPIDFEAAVDLVGISMRMTAEAEAYAVADGFRARGVPVVIGGPQASVRPYRAKRHADAVVVGEGEPLWPVLLRDFAQRELKDYYVCSPAPFDPRGGTLHQLSELPDLARVPVPRRDLYGRKYQFDTVFAARGCHVGCDFCSVPALFGTTTRLRPVAAVVEEISGLDGFYYLLDDTVFGRPDTFDYYLKLYDAIARLPQRNPWHGQANLDAAATEQGREVILRAAQAGLLYAAVGMESINPAVLRRTGALGKSGARDPAEAVARMEERVRFIQEAGILVSGWFVLGYEEDDIETFHRTAELCQKMGVMPVLSPVNALPGTRLYERLEREGVLDNRNSLTNYPNPRLEKQPVIEALARSIDEGFSWRQILRRTLRLWRALGRVAGNTPRDRIMKTTAAAQIQRGMAEVLRRELGNLASERSQNYAEDEG
ncbi:MAG: B12-binding domain-containing radical SAM protein [Deltaproteobacteria bacterium]|nr:B12-binding domain-containing radical SAM protein [Deltaproteobacteria bacterium]